MKRAMAIGAYGAMECLEELVVQNEKDQKDEANDDSYGNQFLLFGPAAHKAMRKR